MRYNMDRFRGILVALNGCYDAEGNINEEALRKIAHWYKDKGIDGLYLCGSTGEGVVMTMEERMRTTEIVCEEVADSMTILVHVGACSTKEAVALAKHAEKCGAHGTSAVPSIYYNIPESAIAAHWNAIADAADLPFIIYNNPGCSHYSLSPALFKEMLKNERVCGVKNTSLPVMDITVFKDLAPEGFIVYNGPDEQLAAGLAMGADGGIGGTYGTMPEVYVSIYKMIQMGAYKEAFEVQKKTTMVILNDLLALGSLYSTAKFIIKARSGVDMGNARMPLPRAEEDDPRLPGVIANVEAHVAYVLDVLAECEKKYK